LGRLKKYNKPAQTTVSITVEDREYLESKKIHSDEPLWEVVKKILRNYERLREEYENIKGELDTNALLLEESRKTSKNRLNFVDRLKEENESLRTEIKTSQIVTVE
jgi:hypothetical protein